MLSSRTPRKGVEQLRSKPPQAKPRRPRVTELRKARPVRSSGCAQKEKKMKKLILWILAAFIFLNTACAGSAGNEVTGREDSEMKIKITIDNGKSKNKISAILEDNSSARFFYGELKNGEITVQMHDYGSFEKVGPLGQSFPRNDQQINTESGDIILYQGNQISLYYDENSWSFTRLGRVEGLSQEELKNILGNGNCTAVFEIW